MNFFSILHLEDSLADHELVGHILGRSGWHFKLFHVDTLEAFETALRGGGFDLVLADYHLAHAARADLNRRLGRVQPARVAYQRALELAQQGADRQFLQMRLDQLAAD